MRTATPLLFIALCGACAFARADISVRDTGEDGIVLSNLDEPVPRIGPTRMKGPAPRRQEQSIALRGDAFTPLVRAAAQAHDLPEALLRALIEVESGFDPHAVSPKGALGLTQLMPATARALKVADPRDPAANIDGGARHLKDLLARNGNNVALALAAYNAGEAAVQRAGGIPPFAETRAYVPRVLARYHHLQSHGS
jgi:soluble lytic murein transglycosylase-like protein